MRKGHVPCNILNPFPPTSTAFLHLLSGNPLSRLLPHSHPRGPQAPPPARVGAQQFKLFLAKPHPPGDASQGEAAPAPPGASRGKRLKPEPLGPCQAGSRAGTGPFRTTRLSAAGSQSCSLVARSGGGLHTRLTTQQLLLSPPSPSPGPAIPASSAEGVPGQPCSLSLSLRAGHLGGGQLPCVQGRFGGQGWTPMLPAWPSGCFTPGSRRATESDGDCGPGPGKCLAGTVPEASPQPGI